MNDIETAVRCRDAMWADDLASQDLGMTVTVESPGASVVDMVVRDNMVNGHDLCHGGYIFTLADSAFAFACNTYDQVTVAASASIEFLRPARRGDTLRAEATERHRGGRTGVYDIVVSNQDGKRIALFLGRSYATRQPILQK